MVVVHSDRRANTPRTLEDAQIRLALEKALPTVWRNIQPLGQRKVMSGVAAALEAGQDLEAILGVLSADCPGVGNWRGLVVERGKELLATYGAARCISPLTPSASPPRGHTGVPAAQKTANGENGSYRGEPPSDEDLAPLRALRESYSRRGDPPIASPAPAEAP